MENTVGSRGSLHPIYKKPGSVAPGRTTATIPITALAPYSLCSKPADPTIDEAPTMNEIPDGAWHGPPLRGRNLGGGTLADELGDQTTLLVFLRHLG